MKKNTLMKKGFTLVEMMIVVAIIAVLAGIAVPQYNKYVRKAEATEAIRLMKQIVDAEGIYRSTHDRYIENSSANNTGLDILGVEITTEGQFDHYEVTACGTDDDVGVIIQAWTGDTVSAANSVYMYYPRDMLPANHDADLYDGTTFLYNYINEENNAATPACPTS